MPIQQTPRREKSLKEMASKPGPLTQWPWQKLGNFKYALLAPFVARSLQKLMRAKNEGKEIDYFNLSIFPILLLRLLHSQLWITISRFRTARSKHRIINKSLDFEQVDRERNWDDQILFTALLFFAGNEIIPGAAYLPWWESRGVILLALLHVGPVEFIYYWLHRALHHHFLYSRYHSHHHASIVTEPITCQHVIIKGYFSSILFLAAVIHPFAEEVAYFVLFAIPLLTMTVTGTGSITAAAAYLIYVDFMNYMGHCNFELVPKWLFDFFPPLKYLMYTPSFHSLHHTQFRTNYSLFMPFYDYIYGTMDKSSDQLYENCLKGKEEEIPDVVHITHLTTFQSIYHLRLGFASLSSKPYESKWYMWVMSPITLVSAILTGMYGTTFTVEKNRMKKLNLETWAIPKYSFQYMSPSRTKEINGMIEKAIVEAEERGAKVVSLGLLNQGDELNGNGSLYYKNNPKLKIKIVDGTSLAAAVVLNNIPFRDIKSVLLAGKVSKMACVLTSTLCQKGTKVMVARRDSYEILKQKLPPELVDHVIFSETYTSQVWLVGDGLKKQEQRKAAKGVHFIPFSQFPPRKVRDDCVYHSTPALIAPKEYENMHTCENWLPRKVMSAWRVAGIVHALEGWDAGECGDKAMDIKKVWKAALDNGFLPLTENMR